MAAMAVSADRVGAQANPTGARCSRSSPATSSGCATPPARRRPRSCSATPQGRALVVRLKWLPGNMSQPHSHPNDRHFVVISGTWWLGSGEKYDPRFHRAAGPGTYVYHKANGIHYDSAKNEEVIIQVWGMGPDTNNPAPAACGTIVFGLQSSVFSPASWSLNRVASPSRACLGGRSDDAPSDVRRRRCCRMEYDRALLRRARIAKHCGVNAGYSVGAALPPV